MKIEIKERVDFTITVVILIVLFGLLFLASNYSWLSPLIILLLFILFGLQYKSFQFSNQEVIINYPLLKLKNKRFSLEQIRRIEVDYDVGSPGVEGLIRIYSETSKFKIQIRRELDYYLLINRLRFKTNWSAKITVIASEEMRNKLLEGYNE